MPYPRKRPELKTGHSNGKKEVPRLGIVPARTERVPAPKPPNGLLPKARRIWRAYWSSQVSSAADREADMHRIERWVKFIDEFERVWDVFRKTRLVKGSTGQPVLNPLAAYLQQLETNISRAESELGLTPMARLRLGITYGQAMLTAEALNRAIDERAGEPAALESVADWEADWEAV